MTFSFRSLLQPLPLAIGIGVMTILTVFQGPQQVFWKQLEQRYRQIDGRADWQIAERQRLEKEAEDARLAEEARITKEKREAEEKAEQERQAALARQKEEEEQARLYREKAEQVASLKAQQASLQRETAALRTLPGKGTNDMLLLLHRALSTGIVQSAKEHMAEQSIAPADVAAGNYCGRNFFSTLYRNVNVDAIMCAVWTSANEKRDEDSFFKHYMTILTLSRWPAIADALTLPSEARKYTLGQRMFIPWARRIEAGDELPRVYGAALDLAPLFKSPLGSVTTQEMLKSATNDEIDEIRDAIIPRLTQLSEKTLKLKEVQSELERASAELRDLPPPPAGFTPPPELSAPAELPPPVSLESDATAPPKSARAPKKKKKAPPAYRPSGPDPFASRG